jgi:hypothetical protein
MAGGLLTGRPRFDSRQGQEICVYFTAPRPVLGPTQPPIQWVQGVKRPRPEANHSPASNTEVFFVAWCLVN